MTYNKQDGGYTTTDLKHLLKKPEQLQYVTEHEALMYLFSQDCHEVEKCYHYHFADGKLKYKAKFHKKHIGIMWPTRDFNVTLPNSRLVL